MKPNTNSLSLEAMRKEAEGQKLLVREVPLSEVKIHSADRLQLEGLDMRMSGRAFKDLTKALGMTSAGGKTVTSGSSDLSAGTGAQVLNVVRQAVSSAKKTRLVIAADSHGQIQRIYTPKNAPTILEGGYFKFLEGYLNTDNFDITSFACRNGVLSTNLVVPGIDADIDGLDDESFTPGVNVKLDSDGIHVSPMTLRRICTNQLEFPVLNQAKMAVPLSRFDLHSMKELPGFLRELAVLQKLNYVDPAYIARVKLAAATPASYAEIVEADAKIKGAVDPSVEAWQLSRWTDVESSESAYVKAGIRFDLMDKKKLTHLRADRTVWDLANQVTEFASHKYPGIAIAEATRSNLRQFAGKLLVERFDCEHEEMKQAF